MHPRELESLAESLPRVVEAMIEPRPLQCEGSAAVGELVGAYAMHRGARPLLRSDHVYHADLRCE